MPRLSLWKPTKSNDYRYFDRTIKEQFQVGGTDLLVHKYVGPANTGPSDDITQPQIDVPTATAIQDLMFLENRDRVYDSSVYRIRGHYNVQNLDFDLSQFGLFLSNDTIFITVHYNTMIDLVGRKFMVGDVLELPHLTDYHPLNETLPISLRRFYQITDANFASEGFSQTWYPHLWRIKCEPLVNSQEFQSILNVPTNTDNYLGTYDPTQEYEPGYTVTYGDKVYTPIQHVPPGVYPPDPAYWKEDTDNPTLGGVISTYNKNIEINNKVIEEAARLVPKTGYDTTPFYVVPTYEDNTPAPPVNVITTNESSNGGPILGSGVIVVIKNPMYSVASPVVKLSVNPGISPNKRAILSVGYVAPDRTDTNSGPVGGDIVLTASITDPSLVPYGTADSTLSLASQEINFFVTSDDTPVKSTVVKLLEWTDNLQVGLLLTTTVYSSNGTAQKMFPENTYITALDSVNRTITVSNPTQATLEAGLLIEVAYNFVGQPSKVMNYRADCDPRFLFIRRSSPRSFGYINGYLTGDGKAPNGEPCGAGVAFPGNPQNGDYFLRTDYLPQRLFRWDGIAWRQISENVRTGKALAADSQSQRSSFVNNTERTNTSSGQSIPQRQSLSSVVNLKPD